MVNPNRFYTYAYLREDRTPYYVGKGCGDRAHRRNKCEIKSPKDKSRIIFLKQNLTEEDAFKHEIYMIAVFGRKDLGTGILRNKTNGGEGPSGVMRSQEFKRKLSNANMGENNPNYGKTTSEEIRKKQSVAMKGKNNHFYGKSHSEEIRKKLSEVNKGKSPSEETRKKLSEKKKGKNHPNYGKKWWNNGIQNKCSKQCPGDDWVPGRK